MGERIYIAYDFKVNPVQPGTEILIAELGYMDFESFVETDEGCTAYIQKVDWREDILEEINILKSEAFQISYAMQAIAPLNWNAEWEKNFNPIVVDERVTVRAPFHDLASTEFDLIIEPKMSFGTGHHETTHMMIQHMLRNDLRDKTVLDMGCGTGVLAILAEKLGASQIDAIDIDDWCFINSKENVERNHCKLISVYQGTSQLLTGKTYDIIMANINRNILLEDLPIYAQCLKKGGQLYLSGFFKSDIPVIEQACRANMLKLNEIIERGQWVALKFLP